MGCHVESTATADSAADPTDDISGRLRCGPSMRSLRIQFRARPCQPSCQPFSVSQVSPSAIGHLAGGSSSFAPASASPAEYVADPCAATLTNVVLAQRAVHARRVECGSHNQ
jgi:hypothetical protein